jgi:ABC-type glycerol-3-phosphate transport system substrate-binding protein
MDELKAVIIGKASFSQPKYSAFYNLLADLKKKGYLNSDVASISFDQGLNLFERKKVAMSWVTDGHVSSAAKALGGAKAMGVSSIPVWGKGKLATSYDTTQSSSAFITSWSKHPRAAAQFLTFLHSAQALKAWYKATGVFPADKRFPASLFKDPIAKKQLALNLSPVSVWPENFLPPQVDGNADLPVGELITSGSGTPAGNRVLDVGGISVRRLWPTASPTARSQNASGSPARPSRPTSDTSSPSSPCRRTTSTTGPSSPC